MAESCFKISDDINENCSSFNANFDWEQDAIIFNREDVKTLTNDNTNPTLVTDLVLKTGKKGYTVRFREPKPMDALAETTEEKPFGKTYKVEGEIVIYGRDPEAAYEKFILDNSRAAILMRQSSKAGTSSYRVLYGIESGLKPAAGETFTKEKGGYVFKFMADFLTYPQQFLWKTDEATTAAVEAALLVNGI